MNTLKVGDKISIKGKLGTVAQVYATGAVLIEWASGRVEYLNSKKLDHEV